MADYQMFLAREIEGRLKEKCDKLADAIVDDTGKIFLTSIYSWGRDLLFFTELSCLVRYLALHVKLHWT